MTNPKGGRGNVAPYNTFTARIPDDLKPQIDAIVGTYKALKLSGQEEELKQFLNNVETAVVSTTYKTSTKLPTLEEAQKIANKLLAQKKSKQVIVEKLLQVLYNQE